MSRVTIKDLAEKLGLSKTAVSFAFNSPEKLPAETVTRILALAEQLGYSPNPLARSMAKGKTGVIGLLVPQELTRILRNPFFPELIAGIGEACDSCGCSLLLVPPLAGCLGKAIDRAGVDGFLTLGLESAQESMQRIRQRQLPVVVIDSNTETDAPCVDTDDIDGAYQAMDLVLQCGCRKILITALPNPHTLSWQKFTGTLSRRMSGYRKALEQHNLDLNSPGISLMLSEVDAGAAAAGFSTHLQQEQPPEAVLCMSDIQAYGILQAAQEHGIRIPEDMSLIGFDDIPFSRLLTPPLTTVAQPIREKGRRAADTLLNLINTQTLPENRHIILPVSLVLRSTHKAH